MTFQSSCIVLSLLAVLGAGGVNPATAAPLFHSEALKPRSCSGKTSVYMAKCHVIVRNGDPSGHPGAKNDDDKVLIFEGCIPAWVYEDPNLEIVKEDECPMCSDEKD